jgi:hypothetical protein
MPQDINNPASEYNISYNLNLNYEMQFLKKWYFPFINFENPLYIGFRTSE